MKKFYILLFILLLITGCWKKEDISSQDKTQDNTVEQKTCIEKIEKTKIKWTSMSPTFKNGDIVDIMVGYQKCNELKRNDIVVYNYAGNDIPVIKQIKWLSGDKFDLKQNENSWNILINDKVLKNSQDKAYKISDSNAKMLKLYAKSYPVIPKDTYLLLWEKIWWTMDSTKFWLVWKSDIHWVLKR